MKINYKIALPLFALLLLLVLGSVFLSFLNKELKSANFEIKQPTLIEISKGSSLKQVADQLQGAKLIKNQTLFVYAAKFFGKNINAGFYEVSASASMVDIINLIDSGNVKLIKVTIPEGWRVEQIAKKLAEEKILDYADFIAKAEEHEGKLFPDTYYLNPRMAADEVIKMMTDNYADRISGLSVSEDDLILASIVEREAAKDSERALIAGVYTNRLNRKMKLEADPTVQYGKDSNLYSKLEEEEKIDFKFWSAVGFSDYQSVSSLLNTYTHSGLPPKPICNPGLKSIEAALNPQNHNYLYFLQHDGEIYPAKTLSEHDVNRARILGQR